MIVTARCRIRVGRHRTADSEVSVPLKFAFGVYVKLRCSRAARQRAVLGPAVTQHRAASGFVSLSTHPLAAPGARCLPGEYASSFAVGWSSRPFRDLTSACRNPVSITVARRYVKLSLPLQFAFA